MHSPRLFSAPVVTLLMGRRRRWLTARVGHGRSAPTFTLNDTFLGFTFQDLVDQGLVPRWSEYALNAVADKAALSRRSSQVRLDRHTGR